MSLDWLGDAVASLKRDALLRACRTVHALPGGRCRVGGRVLLNFAGNDYLDLAGDQRLIEAARGALGDGAGARGSPLVCGRGPWHERLEQRLAAFEGTEAAILFPTGYAANVGAIAALVGPGDLVIGDRLNHASLVDGCRLSGARFRVYRHCDADALDRELGKHADVRRKLIVTDSVFSMDGDLAPLPQVWEVAQRYDAMLLIDEAHATGVWGAGGRGAAEYQSLHDERIVRVGTLSKALGVQGGFVVGSQTLIDWLWNSARTQMFSTALAPTLCAAACAALEIIEQEPQRRKRLLERCDAFRLMLQERGIDPVPESRGPIVPVVVGEAADAVRLGAALESRGFLVGAIRPPTVPRGTARLRISISAAHDPSMLAALADAISGIMRRAV